MAVGGIGENGKPSDCWQVFADAPKHKFGSLGHPRAFHTMTYIGTHLVSPAGPMDGIVFVAGGWDGTGYAKECELLAYGYRSEEGQDGVEVRGGPSLKFARHNACAIRIPDAGATRRSYMAKGVLISGGAFEECGLEYYNVERGRMEYRECPGQRLQKGVLVSCKRFEERTGDSRCILFAGGFLEGSTASSQALLIDYDDLSAVSLPPMLEARYDHEAIELEDGRILIVGGIGADGKALASTEIFDPQQRTFSAGPRLLWPVSDGGVTAWTNEFGEEDLIFVAGGSPNRPRADTQVTRAPYKKFHRGPRLATARSGTKAYFIESDFCWARRLIVFGGAVPEENRCEEYDPYYWSGTSWNERLERSWRRLKWGMGLD